MASNDYPGFRWADPTCDRHFRLMPREVVGVEVDGGMAPTIWATLSKSAQAVLPVLTRHADEAGIAFPGESRLAAMAGLTRKTARAAVRELVGANLVEASPKVSRTGRRTTLYKVRLGGADGITLPSLHIDGGLWACLTPVARSLAIAFRFFAKPRPDLDPLFGEWIEGDALAEYIRERLADYCNAEPSVLREFAGIGPRSYGAAIDSLRKGYFIEPDEARPDYWRVSIWPPRIKRADYLNALLNGEEW